MTVLEIAEILKAEVLFEGDMDEEVITACGSDMMSDVLAFVKDQSVLLTGLMNAQVVRTAEMMDMHCVIFVRGKRVDPTVLALAEEKNITILSSPYRMFTACGLLYSNGLRGGCDL
ncbi:MAG: DRTGG domain-containing protein [Clostridia bacterium]